MPPQIHRCAVEMKRQDFFEGRWQPYLDRAAVIHPNYAGRLDGGKVRAACHHPPGPMPMRAPGGLIVLHRVVVEDCSLRKGLMLRQRLKDGRARKMRAALPVVQLHPSWLCCVTRPLTARCAAGGGPPAGGRRAGPPGHPPPREQAPPRLARLLAAQDRRGKQGPILLRDENDLFLGWLSRFYLTRFA